MKTYVTPFRGKYVGKIGTINGDLQERQRACDVLRIVVMMFNPGLPSYPIVIQLKNLREATDLELLCLETEIMRAARDPHKKPIMIAPNRRVLQ